MTPLPQPNTTQVARAGLMTHASDMTELGLGA